MRGVTGSNYWGLGVLSRWPVSLRWLNGSHLKPRQKLCLPQGLAFLKLLGMMLMWLFCRWPEERSKGSFSSQHWKCVTWGVWNCWPPSTTLFWGVWPSHCLCLFFPGGPHLLFNSRLRLPEVLFLPQSPGAGAQLQPTERRLCLLPWSTREVSPLRFF